MLAPRVRKKKAVFTIEQDAIGRQRQRAAHRALIPVVEPIGRREIGARNIHTAQRFAVIEHKPREEKRNEKAGEKQSAPLVPATPTANAAHGADGRTGRRRHKQEMAPSGTARRLLIDEKRRSVRQRYTFIVMQGTRDSAFSPTETSALPGFIDGFGEKSENRPKKANENAEGSAQNAGISTKILRFFPESSPLLLHTRRPSDPKASENECTLPTMGEEMPTTPRPSRDFIDRHRRNEEPHPTF